jgi:RNA polymerase sigma factor for flagellar operon FliA
MNSVPANTTEVWKRYCMSRKTEDRNWLVEHYAPLVQKHAARMSTKLPPQVSYDEICSAAYQGLIDAVDAFDPERAIKFETFCSQRISGSVLDWLRNTDYQTRTVRKFERKREEVRDELMRKLGREPSVSEIAAYLEMTEENFDRLSTLSRRGQEVHFSSLSSEEGASGPGTSRAWEPADIRSEIPEKQLSREWVVDYMTRGLSKDEKSVLILYYYEEMTMAEIGASINLSESRVSQIHKNVLEVLRGRFSRKDAEKLVA